MTHVPKAKQPPAGGTVARRWLTQNWIGRCGRNAVKIRTGLSPPYSRQPLARLNLGGIPAKGRCSPAGKAGLLFDLVVMGMTVQEQPLTARQLEGYRQWLRELDAEAREAGGSLQECDSELERYFLPETRCGRQVYESFTDEELLDILIQTMERPGHSPRYEAVYCIYLKYIKLRFRGLHNAKTLARGRMKRRELEQRWPPDWPDRVTSEPVEALLRSRGYREDAPEMELPRELCASCRKSGLPPELTAEEQQKLERLGCGDAPSVLRRMGIPALNKRTLRHLTRYWKTQREKHPWKEETAWQG